MLDISFNVLYYTVPSLKASNIIFEVLVVVGLDSLYEQSHKNLKNISGSIIIILNELKTRLIASVLTIFYKVILKIIIEMHILSTLQH